MSYPNANTLSGCITSLSSSVSLLGSSLVSINTMDEDFSRLKVILDQNRIFTLIPEYDLNVAKKSLVHEIEPKILKLTDSIKTKLSKLERKNSNLVSKIQLNNVRISNFRNDSTEREDDNDNLEGTQEEIDKLKQLRLKRDRLKYKISSINLQNRKARLSLINR